MAVIPPQYLRAFTEPPVPASVRLVGRATKGSRTLSRLDGLQTHTGKFAQTCDATRSKEADDRLSEARTIAQKLQGVEEALNAITAQMPERQRTYARIKTTFEREQAHLRETALDLASSGMLGVYDSLKGADTFRSIKDFETLIATMRKAKSKLNDLSLKLANLDLAISAAAARSLEEREKATQDLLHFVQDTLGEADELTGDDATTRAFKAAGKGLSIAGKMQSALDATASLYQLQRAAETLNNLENISELEAQGLKNTLLPLQRKLSNDLDKALSSPVLLDLKEPRPELNCGS